MSCKIVFSSSKILDDLFIYEENFTKGLWDRKCVFLVGVYAKIVITNTSNDSNRLTVIYTITP